MNGLFRGIWFPILNLFSLHKAKWWHFTQHNFYHKSDIDNFYHKSDIDIWARAWENQQTDVHLAKTQISLHVHAVWSEFLLGTLWGAKDPMLLPAHSKDTDQRLCRYPGWPESLLGGERGGSVVECRTPEREVRGSRPTSAVLCPWARHFTPRKYWLITQEAMAPSRHDWKIVDWDVKPQHNQIFAGYTRFCWFCRAQAHLLTKNKAYWHCCGDQLETLGPVVQN